MNEILFIAQVFILFGSLVLVEKLFKNSGVIVWVTFATIIAEIMSSKTVDVFGLTVTSGTVMFAANFTATDILSEKYGKNESKKAVNISMFFCVLYIIVCEILTHLIPSKTDFADRFIKGLFSFQPRITASSVVMCYIANMADIYLFEKIKKATKGKYLWIRNNVATIICNCSENVLFTFGAFYGILNMKQVLWTSLGVSIIEAVVALLDTPFVYISVYGNKNKQAEA